MPSQHHRSSTTAMSKRGQIVGLASLTGKYRLPLRNISTLTKVPISTCSDIIQLSKRRRATNPNASDISWAKDNLLPCPTRKKGDGEILNKEQKKQVIALATQDASHCRKPLHELVIELGFQICTNTAARVFAANGIHRCTPTTKPFLTVKQKEERLLFAQTHINFDFIRVLFHDESYFEPSGLCSMHAKEVLRRAGEQFLPRNINRKFSKGKSATFWGGIMYGYSGAELPWYLFPNPLEATEEKIAATNHLLREFQWDTDDYNYFIDIGEQHTLPIKKSHSTKRKGGIDWFIYRERVLRAKVFLFLPSQMDIHQILLYYYKDNAPCHRSRFIEVAL